MSKKEEVSAKPVAVTKPRVFLSPVRGTKHAAVYDFDAISNVLQKLSEIPLPYNTIAPIITTIQNAQIYPVEQINTAINLFNNTEVEEQPEQETLTPFSALKK